MTQRTALIVGAGVAGLAAAWWLKKVGWSAVVIERAPDLRTAGHMLGLSGPGLEVAKRMGIEPQLQAKACVINENIYRDRKGRELLRMKYREFLKELPYIALRRTDLVQALHDALPPDVDIRFGATAEKIVDHGDRVSVQLADGTELTGDLLIGADGLRSWVRREVFGSDERFFKELGYRFATYDLEDTLNLGIDFLSYTEPGHIVEYYTLRDGRIAALHAWVTSETGIVPDEARWAAIRRAARTAHPQVHEIVDAAQRGPLPLIDNLTLVDMPSWSEGRVVLLGDAAHCLTLISGQGAGMSIASAAMLAEELGSKPIDEALRRHDERLRPAIVKLQERSRKMGALFVPASSLSFHLRNFALRHMPRAWLGQYFINAIRSEILATADAS
ncbi:FAD-dependent oxidoreductase [Hyphomicrobium sp. LHD-15]|uniref:FAD-dependent oxidoreductase n=1 Tax=Hyphomicrobium sp. LHD-15 TaxID=3072142 RepID=UPI00280F9EBC|nr:FAD-dependent oxidoreductase [Hyphomicrobium sp. LHD-15]MDQ8699228.1 FAD-dependent monooxygenase [Hyphomicrobium sp. LHD-15]